MRLSGQAELESDRIEAENEMDDSINQVFSRGGCQLEQDTDAAALRLGSSLCHMISLTTDLMRANSVLQQGRPFSTLPGGSFVVLVMLRTEDGGIVTKWTANGGPHGEVNEVRRYIVSEPS